MSHAMLLREGVGSCLWSVSRGLARNNAEYKTRLDGRGCAADKIILTGAARGRTVN